MPVQLQPVLSCLHQETRRFSACPSGVDCFPGPSTPAVCSDRRPRGLPLGLRWPLMAPEPHAHHTQPSLCHSRPGAAFLNSQDPSPSVGPSGLSVYIRSGGSQHQCLLSCVVVVNHGSRHDSCVCRQPHLRKRPWWWAGLCSTLVPPSACPSPHIWPLRYHQPLPPGSSNAGPLPCPNEPGPRPHTRPQDSGASNSESRGHLTRVYEVSEWGVYSHSAIWGNYLANCVQTFVGVTGRSLHWVI